MLLWFSLDSILISLRKSCLMPDEIRTIPAECITCHLPMYPGQPCENPISYEDMGDGEVYKRLTWPIVYLFTCHDCGTPPGYLHHPGCHNEVCPKCLGQAIGCGCPEQDEEEEWPDDDDGWNDV